MASVQLVQPQSADTTDSEVTRFADQLTTDSIASVKRLTKIYGRLRALDECNLEVKRGSVFGLLGPNGAGKTTLIRMILGFIKPTSGAATVDGFNCVADPVGVRRRVAYLPAEAKLFRMMKGTSVIEFFAAVHPLSSIQRAREIADRLELDLGRRVAFMSTGMRQKLAIACVLACQAPLVILDEPTANLDPTVRIEVLKLIGEARRNGSTILFSSHIFSEIEEQCDLAAIMQRGKVILELNVKNLRSTHRVTATQSIDNPLRTESLPPNVVFVSGFKSDVGADRIAFDIHGALESLLPWMTKMQLQDIRIEPVGLKSVYESCCAS